MLIGTDNGRDIRHPHLIKIEQRDAAGYPRRYQMNNRPPSYNYTTLVATNRPPSHCPKSRRLRREWEAAEAARIAREAEQPVYDPSSGGDCYGGGYYGGNYGGASSGDDYVAGSGSGGGGYEAGSSSAGYWGYY